MTEYLVLAASFDKEAWEEIGRKEARSAHSAIRQVLEEHPGNPTNDASHFVAVPSRSWQPVIVKTETKTALRFS